MLLALIIIFIFTTLLYTRLSINIWSSTILIRVNLTLTTLNIKLANIHIHKDKGVGKIVGCLSCYTIL